MAVAVTAGIGAITVPASAAQPEPLAVRSDPVYSYANAVRETAYVDTGLTAPNGAKVRVAADIIRPREATGRVPVIMDASPYYTTLGRGNESQKKTYDAAGKPVQFPLWYDNYFVPRGYAVVLVDLSGTARSNGCVDVGGRSEVTSAKAVIDWLNGRATGYTTATGTTTISSSWSTGAVGMIGKSWDGTIANGVAATGVAGLKTIVPIGAISSWYDYYRASGATYTSGSPAGLAPVVENSQGASNCGSVKTTLTNGSPSSGDYTAMYRERDYVPNAANVKASVFVVHGLGDLNVKSVNFGQWWNALPAGVERKIWLSQTGHVDPFDYRRQVWVDTLHKWFDHYLLGVDNGVQNDPASTVEQKPDVWKDDRAWPLTTTPTTLRLQPGTSAGVGTLGTTAPPAGSTATVTDNRSSEYDWITNPTNASSARAIYRTGALASDVRISGTSTITVTTTSSQSAARLTAVLVDYGTATIRNYRGTGEGIRNLSTRSCWGESGTGDSACYLDTETNTTSVSQNIIARGWADLGHYAGLESRRTLSANTPYTITFNIATTDQVIPAGHRLAVVIGSTDSSYISSAGTSTRLGIDLSKTTLRVPLIGSI
ncbi:Xaa-Pro dipeptidyl-peptidase [Actinokineospora sp. NBRC 105648]|uniref:Xaa-Pro dipeptidyl-peptidase n=1 Tax=Actinokineospora sp. NBRC 105648 TaxID=3032206 RepID=UPI0024A1DCEF|nr:Xaa-Pro dipeptidyl-peptidase [Actinokineospora sp. NBRC 105648]GLZ38553.1 X-Pro dipeptidyl-peptidase [Actinokineospora sp. NBRC 105648]